MEISWKQAGRNKRFVFWLSLVIAVLFILSIFVPWFFENIIQPKAGIAIHDGILEWLTPPIDWSWAILALIYSGLTLSIVMNYDKPTNVLLGLSVYVVVTWMRMTSIYVFTLEAPRGVIPLTDPFLAMFVYNKSEFVKDLFFSGHISTMSVLSCIETNRVAKIILQLMTLAMALLILSQHVHYTIDVLFAPVITYMVYRVVRRQYAKMLLTG